MMIEVTTTVEQLGEDDPVRVFQARSRLLQALHADPQPEALAGALAAELSAQVRLPADAAQPERDAWKYPVQVRRLLCSFLGMAGSGRQVPALKAALHEVETREEARSALSAINDSSAADALVEALDQHDPGFRIGVIRALGRQPWRQAMTALARLAEDADPAIRLAALEGLANFPEPSNDKLFVSASRDASRRSRLRAEKARLRLAETLRMAGDKKSARAIYSSISRGDGEEPQKQAAQRALRELS